jgi:predicted ATPase
MLWGWAVAQQGQVEGGITRLQEGLAALHVSGSPLHRPAFLAMFAEVYGKAGQPQQGLDLLDEALAMVAATGGRYLEAELHRLKGELLHLQGAGKDTVESCFQDALAIARRQEAKSLELRAAMSLARLWQRQGKQSTAHQLLAEIYDWFTEGFATADLQEAKALLVELSSWGDDSAGCPSFFPLVNP